MYCTACGKDLHNDAVICLACGVATSNRVNGEDENEGSLMGWSVLGFFVPALALILYLVWKDEKPKTAKAVLNGGLIYLCVFGSLLVFYFSIITFIFTFAMLGL